MTTRRRTPATGARLRAATSRFSTCSTSSRPAAAVRRLPRPAAAAAAALLLDLLVAAGRPAACRVTVGVLRAPARAGDGDLPRGLLGLPRAAGRAARCSCSSGSRPSRSARRTTRGADDHGGGRHRARAVPRFPAGAGGAARPGRPLAPSLLFFGCRTRQTAAVRGGAARVRARGLVREWRTRSRASRTAAAATRSTRCSTRRRDLGADRRRRPSSSAATPARWPPGCGRPSPRSRDHTGAGEADGAAWLAGLRPDDRYVEDIWGG